MSVSPAGPPRGRRRSDPSEAAGLPAQSAVRGHQGQRDHRPAHGHLLGQTPETDAAGHWQEFTFLVDGKTSNPNRIDQRVKLGAVEECTIVNTHFWDDRVLHIHTNPFQVTQINVMPQKEPLCRDSVIVEGKEGRVVSAPGLLTIPGSSWSTFS